MSKSDLVFLGICVVLLFAWPLRWEKGPAISNKSIVTQHLQDRWTGQYWVETYAPHKRVIEPLITEDMVWEQMADDPRYLDAIKKLESVKEFGISEKYARKRGIQAEMASYAHTELIRRAYLMRDTATFIWLAVFTASLTVLLVRVLRRYLIGQRNKRESN
ncbi:MAG: hypothetical protein QME76_02055 [Bacillota bacterium]|nr:hypothetical protein [Bacillota bacterium]